MELHTRRALAYIAGRMIAGKNSSSVYDYAVGSHTSMSGQVGQTKAAVYDYDQNCHVSGNNGNLYHFGDKHHIQLKINGDKFSGFDYGSNNHFSGRVNGNAISLYDYGTSAHYNYSI